MKPNFLRVAQLLRDGAKMNTRPEPALWPTLLPHVVQQAHLIPMRKGEPISHVLTLQAAEAWKPGD